MMKTNIIALSYNPVGLESNGLRRATKSVSIKQTIISPH